MELSESFLSVLPNHISSNTTKHFVFFKDKDGKKVCLSGKKVQLLHFNPEFGVKFIEVSEKEAKDKHLGKMRCIGIVSDEYELLILLSKYFCFDISQNYIAPVEVEVYKKDKIKKQKREVKKDNELKINLLPSDRDEIELIKQYRLETNNKKKDKIFRTILFKRGVNNKTWSQIIKSYISFNKHKFNCFNDRTEEDFYQEIVAALHKQVSKWFDVSLNFCFSTYAWHVINCAFNRILQTLSTQKRSLPTTKNIDLDNPENNFDVSSEKLLIHQNSFEDEFYNQNLCRQIENMLELKEINAPEELKKDILEAIKDKSIVTTSLYNLAKKHNVTIEEVFYLEKKLRDNFKHTILRDIITYMKYDINADEELAKKFKRSTGHIIKIRNQFISSVKTKLKGME
ncbi:MAG: hypothetical protein PHF86_04625 [Candidatus Nanoarchaeia archaeon]|jgi:hypothetical protein|nr:hypothetical protein [Candidatus Nanoarchaeia archaeon]